MTVEPLTTEQLAALGPDLLRDYLAKLDEAYTVTSVALVEALGDELEAKRSVLMLKQEAHALKLRAGIAQSVLKSIKESF